MKGSTVDAMSEAVEEAALMLSCISLKYKESASECHSQQLQLRLRRAIVVCFV